MRIVSFALVLLCGGCGAIVTSDKIEKLGSVTDRREGVQYSLPMALLPVQLAVNQDTATFSISVGAPIYINDPKRRYMLRYRANANYDDDVTFAVNSKGFLKQVKADTTDQTGNVLIELARTVSNFARLQGSLIQNVQLLHDTVIDPGDPDQAKQLTNDFSKDIKAFSKRITTYCGATPKYKTDHAEACAEYERLSTEKVPVKITVQRPPAIPNLPPVDCSQAICYRSLQPHALSIVFSGRAQGHTVVDVPNSSPTVAIDIERAFLVNRVTDINFDDNTGMLASVHVVKKSEALAAAKLPLEVAKAVFDTSLIKLRVDYSSQEDALIKNQMALAQDKAKLEQLNSQLQGEVQTAPTVLLTVSNVPTAPAAQKGNVTAPTVPPAPSAGGQPKPQVPDPTNPAAPGT